MPYLNTKYLLLVICLWIGIDMTTYSQSFEDEFNLFLDSANKEFTSGNGSIAEEFVQHVSKINSEYNTFIKDIDKEFSEFLLQSFEEFQLNPPQQYQNSAEPIELARATNQTAINQVQEYAGIEQNVSQNTYSTETPIVVTPQVQSAIYDSTVLNFYGAKHKLSYDTRFSISNIRIINSNTISRQWNFLIKCKYSDLLIQLSDIKTDQNLNDWAYLLLVKKTAEQILPDSENNSQLLTWFLLLKSGCNVKIGFSENKIVLLYPCSNTIYEVPYVDIEGEKYYSLNPNIKLINTYKANYPTARKKISLEINRPINLPLSDHSQLLEYLYNGVKYQYEFSINKNYIDFYKDYPKTELYIYRNAPVSGVLKESLNHHFVNQKGLPDSTNYPNFLLHFVQNGFKYLSDKEQFGEEKFFFPEEMFYYKASDCEDRVLLYSYLLNEYTNHKSVGLSFEGHLMLGIQNLENIQGIKVEYDGENYILTDPSYINAPIGLIPPKFHSKKPKIIQLDAPGKKINQNDIWKLANKYDIYRNDISQNLTVNANGAFFIAGNKWESDSLINSDICFAKFENDKPAWILTFSGPGKNQGLCVSTDSFSNNYFLAKFSDTLQFQNHNINPIASKNYLIVKTDANGSLKWHKVISPKVGTNSISCEISSEGEIHYLHENLKSESFISHSIHPQEKGNLLIEIYPSEFLSFKIDSLRLEEGDKYDIINWLVRENARLIKMKYNDNISGLMSVFNMLLYTNQQLTGSILSEAVTKTFPANKRTSASINEIEKISSIQKESDLFSLSINDYPNIFLGTMKILQDTELKLSLSDKSAKIIILSGVKVGSNKNWLDVNYILIDKFNGEVMYDYDNHYRKKMPIREEVLL